MHKEFLRKFVAGISFALFQIFVILGIFYLVLCTGLFMDFENDKNKVADTLQISSTEASKVSHNMISYVKYQNVELDDFFTDREISHLTEIQGMIKKGLLLEIIIGVYIAVSYLKTIRKLDYKSIKKIYVISIIIEAVICGGLALAALFDTRGFVDNFHEIFFKTKTWILNPIYDKSVYMFSDAFFVDAILVIVCGLIIMNVLLNSLLKNFIDK